MTNYQVLTTMPKRTAKQFAVIALNVNDVNASQSSHLARRQCIAVKPHRLSTFRSHLGVNASRLSHSMSTLPQRLTRCQQFAVIQFDSSPSMTTLRISRLQRRNAVCSRLARCRCFANVTFNGNALHTSPAYIAFNVNASQPSRSMSMLCKRLTRCQCSAYIAFKVNASQLSLIRCRCFAAISFEVNAFAAISFDVSASQSSHSMSMLRSHLVRCQCFRSHLFRCQRFA